MSSSELVLGGEEPGAEVASQGQELAWQEPPTWAKMWNRAFGIFFNAGIVAAIRASSNPPRVQAPDPSGAAAAAPEWVQQEWAQKAAGRLRGRQFARDTAVFAAGCYLMDGVEAGVNYLRGSQKDTMAKVAGGAAAGGLIGLVWYPRDYRARGLVGAAGAAIGYFSAHIETAATGYLLKQQQQLEREMLHKPESALRPDVNPYYVRALVKARQAAEAEARRRAIETIQEQQRSLGPGGQTARGLAPYGTGEQGGQGGQGGGGGAYDVSGDYGADGSFGASGGGTGLSGGAGGGEGEVVSIGGGASGGASTAGLRRPGRGGGGGGGATMGGGMGGGLPAHDRGVLVIEEEPDVPERGGR